MNITEIEQRQEQLRKNIYNNETKLGNLQARHRELSAQFAGPVENESMLHSLQTQIDDIQRDIETCKNELPMLDKHLVAEQARETKAVKAALSAQKSCAGQMEALSPKLVAALETAHDLNLQLQAVTQRYVVLLKQTGQSIPMKGVTRGSEQMLKVIFETCQAEVKGIAQPRICGRPPYTYI